MKDLFRWDRRRDWKEAVVFFVLTFIWFSALGTGVAFVVRELFGDGFARGALSVLFGCLSPILANTVLRAKALGRGKYLLYLIIAVSLSLISTAASLAWVSYLTTLDGDTRIGSSARDQMAA